MSLYQKYRPQNLAEIVGQDHVKQTLQNAITHNKVGHAYLFSGPHGVGKTSIARILARAVNCTADKDKPCNTCQTCTASLSNTDINIVEIDAASNTGVDNMRELIERVTFPPQGANRKVYIIDEVHMLSKSAFNAILKTLEEPPKHSLFILATTELHKVLSTIISRTQHFELKKITGEQIANHLQNVAKSEDLELSDDAAELVAKSAGGSLRDSLSLLDQLKAYNQKIDVDAVRFIIGIPAHQEMLDLVGASIAKNFAKVLEITDAFVEKGYDVATVIDSLIEIAREVIYTKSGLGSEKDAEANEFKAEPVEKFFSLINALVLAKSQMRWVSLPVIPLQIALMQGKVEELPVSAENSISVSLPVQMPKAQEAVASAPVNAINQATAPVQSPSINEEQVIQSVPKIKVEPEHVSSPEPVQEDAPQDVVENKPVPAAPKDPISPSNIDWHKFVNRIRQDNMKLSSLLVSASFNIVDNTLQIGVPFNFYAERIVESESKSLIKKVYYEFTGQDIEVSAQLSSEAPPTQTSSSPEPQVSPVGQVSKEQKITNQPKTDAVREVFGDLIM